MNVVDLSRWSESGKVIDFRDGRIVEPLEARREVADFLQVGNFCDRYSDEETAEEWAYKCSVFSIEVADFHTFYVGEVGVWVRDSPLRQV